MLVEQHLPQACKSPPFSDFGHSCLQKTSITNRSRGGRNSHCKKKKKKPQSSRSIVTISNFPYPFTHRNFASKKKSIHKHWKQKGTETNSIKERQSSESIHRPAIVPGADRSTKPCLNTISPKKTELHRFWPLLHLQTSLYNRKTPPEIRSKPITKTIRNSIETRISVTGILHHQSYLTPTE